MFCQLIAARTLLGGLVLIGMFALCCAVVYAGMFVKTWLERRLPPAPQPPEEKPASPPPERVYYLLDKPAPKPRARKSPQKLQARRIYFTDEKET